MILLARDDLSLEQFRDVIFFSGGGVDINNHNINITIMVLFMTIHHTLNPTPPLAPDQPHRRRPLVLRLVIKFSRDAGGAWCGLRYRGVTQL